MWLHSHFEIQTCTRYVTFYHLESQHQDRNAEEHRLLLDLTMTGLDRFEYCASARRFQRVSNRAVTTAHKVGRHVPLPEVRITKLRNNKALSTLEHANIKLQPTRNCGDNAGGNPGTAKADVRYTRRPLSIQGIAKSKVNFYTLPNSFTHVSCRLMSFLDTLELIRSTACTSITYKSRILHISNTLRHQPSNE